MQKIEIVDKISRQTGVGRKEALQVVECFMEVVKDSLSNGENVYLRGFGSFVVKYRAEKCRNINKNISVVVPAHDVPGLLNRPGILHWIKNVFGI